MAGALLPDLALLTPNVIATSSSRILVLSLNSPQGRLFSSLQPSSHTQMFPLHAMSATTHSSNIVQRASLGTLQMGFAQMMSFWLKRPKQRKHSMRWNGKVVESKGWRCFRSCLSLHLMDNYNFKLL